MDNQALVGKIISWPNFGDPEEEGFVGCGRGEILAVLESPMILVRKIPRKGDLEPGFMITMPMNIPNLHFFNTLKEEEKWYNWLFDEPAKVVKLVGKQEQ